MTPTAGNGALRVPAFRRYLAGRILGVTGRTVFSVAVGWEVYELTRSTYALALVGLAQVVPVVALALRAGAIIDRVDRRLVAVASQLVMSATAATMSLLAFTHAPVWARFPVLVMYGCAVAFSAPASSALLPTLVPTECRADANAWSSTSFEIASIGGPALAGLLIAWRGDTTVAYTVHTVGSLSFAAVLLSLPSAAGVPPKVVAHVERDARAGLRFVFASKYLLPAITLDLFAVLLGGVTALLPVFARDILRVGPTGLGWMRAAPSIGAFAMAIVTTRLPPWKRPGVVLLFVVSGFGIATIGFGLSRSYALSLFLLGLTGLFDNVSVVIRMTLEQMVTPDAMRGRVSAVQYVFVGMSNQFGEVESGIAAGLMGAVGATLFGGLGTLVVVLWVAWRWPALARVGPLAQLQPESLA